MALALHPSTHILTYGSAPYRRRTHLRLVVAPESPTSQRTHQVSALVYRRRRICVAAAAVGLLTVGIFGFVGGFGDSARADTTISGISGDGATPRVVIAQPGDTLWAIARRIAPVGSITGLVDQLVQMNGDNITAGQEVRVP